MEVRPQLYKSWLYKVLMALDRRSEFYDLYGNIVLITFDLFLCVCVSEESPYIKYIKTKLVFVSKE